MTDRRCLAQETMPIIIIDVIIVMIFSGQSLHMQIHLGSNYKSIDE